MARPRENGTKISVGGILTGGEWCENKLLAKELEENKLDFVDSVLLHMSRSFPGLERVKQYMEHESIQAGEYLIRQGEDAFTKRAGRRDGRRDQLVSRWFAFRFSESGTAERCLSPDCQDLAQNPKRRRRACRSSA